MMLYEEIFREFQKKRVKYVLVGGLAYNLLGAYRGTADMDIILKISDENLRKVVSILKKRGYRVRQPVDPMQIADKKTREDWINNKHMKAFNFYKDDELKEIDIIIETPVSYEKAEKTAKHVELNGISIPVISIDNLIKMKKKAGRDIDKLDIKNLEFIKKHKKNE